MTVLITCSSPLPSTIISPVLNSFKNCVPVPVNTPPAVNTDAPDIIFTLSTGIPVSYTHLTLPTTPYV